MKVQNIFKKISARIRQGTADDRKSSHEDTEALEDEMEELNQAVEDDENVDNLTAEINSTQEQQTNEDETEHPMTVIAIFENIIMTV